VTPEELEQLRALPTTITCTTEEFKPRARAALSHAERGGCVVVTTGGESTERRRVRAVLMPPSLDSSWAAEATALSRAWNGHPGGPSRGAEAEKLVLRQLHGADPAGLAMGEKQAAGEVGRIISDSENSRLPSLGGDA
jgi:hypothetical protein